MKWTPRDCIALVVVLIAGGLLFSGIDSIVGWTLIAVIAGYYGIDLTPFIKAGRKRSKERGD